MTILNRFRIPQLSALLTQLLDEEADSTSFSDCAARLSLEFESAFPLGPAAYDGCSPFAKAVADAADKAVDKAEEWQAKWDKMVAAWYTLSGHKVYGDIEQMKIQWMLWATGGQWSE